MFIKNYLKLSAAVFALLILLQGCGLWRNFTTYFNTYFNAKSLFDATEEEILKQKTDLFEFKEPKITSQNSQNLTKVIEKCSKILQFDTESAYFPDALFLTGKSFYYQEEYSKAERKFLELAGLKNSEYDLINKYWLGKTKLQLREFDDGLALLQQAEQQALSEGEDQIYKDANITEISFLINRENYPDAIDKAKSFLAASDDEELKALVSYQLGKIYLLTDDSENAAAAFGEVLNFEPSFQVEFDSKLEYARLLRKLKRDDESLTVLEDLRDQDKFKSNHDKVFLELAYIYRDKKDTAKAIDLLKQVDSTFKQTESSGLADFELAEIYQNDAADYDSSFRYYTKAAGSMAPRDMKLEASTKTRDLTKYFTIKDNIAGLDQQLLYISEPDKFVQDSIDYEITYRKVLEELQSLNPNLDLQNNTPITGRTQPANNQLVNEQQNETQQQNAPQQQVQQPAAGTAMIDLKTLVGPTTKLQDKVLQQQIINGKFKQPVRPILSADTLRSQIAKNYFDLGNLFFSELEVPDSAKYYYDRILNSFQSSKYKVQTMYALGTIYESENNKESADSIFNKIYSDFPKDPLAAEAGKKLGLVATESKINEEGKSDPAYNLFMDAEKKYFAKDFEPAVNQYREIFNKFPESVFAPKALLAAGIIYEQNMKLYDSAAVVYAQLTKKFDKSNYAKAVAAKLEAYNKEKQRLQQEEQKKKAAADSAKVSVDSKLNGKAQTAEIKKNNDMGEKAPADSLLHKDGKIPAVKDSTGNKKTLEETTPAGQIIKKDSAKTAADSTLIKKRMMDEKAGKAKADSTKKRIDY